MQENCITEEEARAKLRVLCEIAGGVGKFAEVVGVSTSAVSQQLHGHKPIHGKIARHMGLRIEKQTTLFYRETDV